MSEARLLEHYVGAVRLIERLILARAPKVPFFPAPARLTDGEVEAIAAHFVTGHQLAQTARR